MTVLMPVYNEVGTIERAISAVLETEELSSRELIVVDDGSTDGTAELLRSREWPADVRVLFHARNQGKGAAVRTALATLNERDREALLLKAEGFNYEEIAATLGLSKGAIGTTLARARRRLVEAYRSEGQGKNVAS